MPDYRLIHRRALRGEKVANLTDFERGVWLAYLLIADDYGVMPFEAGELAKAIWLKGKPHKTVQRALERVRDAGLIQTWVNQGATYCYAHDWQEWQNVRHPRGTIEPCPPPAQIDACKPKTRQLFTDHARNNAAELQKDSRNIAADAAEVREDFGNIAASAAPRARAPGRNANANANANANPNANPTRGIGEGVMAGTLPRDHLNCRAPCERVCVSARQHAILCSRYGGADGHEAAAALDAFYAEVRAQLDPAIPIGDRPWDFWDKQFQAKFGAANGSKSRLTTALEKASQW